MRFLSTLLSTALLVAGVVSGKKTSAERFDEFRGLAKSSNPVKLSETKYRALTSTPRDYTAAVLLTAIDARFACALCTEFQPEYDVLAKSWAKGDKNAESRLIFSSLDFMHGRDVFVSLGLQTAPVLLLFPPTEGPHAVPSAEPLRYDFTTGPPTAEQVRSWIARHLPDRPHPEVKRPVDYFKWATTVAVSLGILTAGIVAWPYVQPLLVNRNVWASVSLMAILLFISGHMFNHIRRVPYVVGDGKGGVNYIAGGFQTQYGMETQIVAALYGILAFCAICIAVRVPRVADSRSQKIHVIGWMSAMFIIYGFLMSIFRAKNGSYPFALPPFM